MTFPCSQDYVPTPQCLFPPPEGPSGVWEHMSVSMLLSDKVVWVCFHQFWLALQPAPVTVTAEATCAS